MDHINPSAADLEDSFENASIAMHWVGPDGTILHANAAELSLLGYARDEYVGRHIADFHVDQDVSADILERLTRNETIRDYEARLRCKDGSIKHVLVDSSALFRDGSFVHTRCLTRDVTESRRFDEVRRYLAAIVDSSDDAIVSKTLDGIITSWNRGAERIFGWTAAEAVGQHITLIIPRERHAEEEGVLARIRRGQIVDHFETIRRTKDGRLLNISLTVSPVRGRDGGIIGASKIARDITERRRLEDERNQALEREREARAVAEASNRLKDELLATVSHELRTPLNSILGYGRMLQNGSLRDEAAQRHAVDVIVRSAMAQTQLVEDLIDLSRLVAGRMDVAFETCDLSALVAEAIDTVRHAAQAKGIALTTTFQPAPSPIVGAPDRLRQVVWNLTMNAIKFTPGGGHVDVTVSHPDDSAQIVVADTGVGIGPDVLPYIFEPFRQEDRSTTRGHGGLGLGLALVKRLVEMHGGTVRGESPGKGRGATFTVSIPRAPMTSGNKGAAP